jgi:hypothetical protein
VISHGSEGGPYLLPWNYRPDVIEDAPVHLMRDPHIADFVLGFVCGLTIGVTLTAVIWAVFD